MMRDILGGAGQYATGAYEEKASEVNMTLFFIGEPHFQDSPWPEYAKTDFIASVQLCGRRCAGERVRTKGQIPFHCCVRHAALGIFP